MFAQAKILVVEDNRDLIRLEKEYLEKENYEVHLASSGARAFEVLKQEPIDLVLLDLNLGDVDGLDILRRIRQSGEGSVPVLIVSSSSEISRKLKGFDTGCDDFITKPFYPEELIARVKIALKRSKHRPSDYMNVEICLGPFRVMPATMEVYRGETRIPEMRNKIFRIFMFFLKNPGQIFTKQQLHDRFWDPLEEVNENTINVHMHELRDLIEVDPKNPKFLLTKRGIGYQFVPEARVEEEILQSEAG